MGSSTTIIRLLRQRTKELKCLAEYKTGETSIFLILRLSFKPQKTIRTEYVSKLLNVANDFRQHDCHATI